jgi:hypothetical protein
VTAPEMTQDELREAGHEPMSPLQALRARCLDCCGQEKEVALCPAADCPSWPFRMGTDPWRKPASEARREAARRTMAEINARRGKGNGAGSSGSPSEHGTEPALASEPTPALTWAIALVDDPPETVRHRGDGSGSCQSGDQFRDRQISDNGDMVTALGETPEGRAA